MKWLTTLLALYLLALSLWPCADEPLLTSEQAGSAVVSALAHDSERSQHHEHDTCTPFCTCACCATTITVVPRFQYTPSTPVETLLTFVAAFSDAPEHPLDPITAIWQPPKHRV
ncbi:hypothetical protein F5984_24365 [Rudanella paleaurantiibacter]|uniref:DUF2946 domain-containing protein n=1 Tax=Rudanella paleaurantiibacter TaxID=2614655 RepID=A0A7J5TSP1_9BACT|nr:MULTISPECIES: DUF6660 family protein [Rudanella]KAB7726457.1 hypothetical protein F5984_24365 [Rudanella paleaurantiibacter]